MLPDFLLSASTINRAPCRTVKNEHGKRVAVSGKSIEPLYLDRYMLTDSWDRWLRAHDSELRELGPIEETHPALLASRIVSNICEQIRGGNALACRVALSLLNEDPRMPFGRALKSQIARAFKSIAERLDENQRLQLSRYRDKLLSLEHPPRESVEFSRLVRSFQALK